MADETGSPDAPAPARPALPASLAEAWGRRGRPGKGPRPGLSLDQIVAAAIRVGAADGLAAVSMGRVAAELGASTMALYRYVSSKTELVDLMVDAAFGAPPPITPGLGWREGLGAWAWHQLAAMRAHAWAVLAPITGPPAMPNTVAWIEQGLACLRDTKLDGGQKMSVILLVTTYVRNQVAIQAQMAQALAATGTTDQQMMMDYGATLGALIDTDRFPELTRVVASGVLSRADDMDDEFTFGLERILDGIAVLVDRLESGAAAERG
jgi:AcrR family transcriptional regulator